MLTVLCGCIGPKWGDVWVHRLARMVEEHCSVPYRFICVSDREIEGITTVPASPVKLDRKKPQGCWVKLDYFRREVSGDGPCIAFDLDIVIVGDIAALQSKKFSTAQIADHISSSVMAWTPSEETDRIYTSEIPYREYPRGDQEFIAIRCDWTPLKGCISYKIHLVPSTRRTLPEGLTIISFHGTPTPADPEVLRYDWNKRTWKDLTITERTTR